jgi:hypothetical protein
MPTKNEVGPQYGGTGSQNDTGRAGISGAQIVADAHGHFFEAVRLGTNATGGGAWSAATAAAGVAPGTALSTTPPFAIWNPPNSGVMAAILVSRFGLLSGTLGVGTIFYAVVETQTSKPTTGTAINPVNQAVGNQGTSKITAYQGSTLSGTPVALAPAFSLGANPTGLMKDQVDGEIVLLPGAVLCMQEIGAAGTTPLGFFGMTWEEIPYLL